MDRQEAIVLLGYKLAAMKEMAEEDWQMHDEEGGEQWEEVLQMAIASLRAQEEVEKNEPLALEELRQMDREPVWVEYSNGARQWHIVRDYLEYADQDIIRWKDRGLEPVQDYGKTWIAYRHKPKDEAEKNEPLTLAELRLLDGEKIYIRYVNHCKTFYNDEIAPYYGKDEQYIQHYSGTLRACDLPLKYYGEEWLAYRRRPTVDKP